MQEAGLLNLTLLRQERSSVKQLLQYETCTVKYLHFNENWIVLCVTNIKMSQFRRGGSGLWACQLTLHCNATNGNWTFPSEYCRLSLSVSFHPRIHLPPTLYILALSKAPPGLRTVRCPRNSTCYVHCILFCSLVLNNQRYGLVSKVWEPWITVKSNRVSYVSHGYSYVICQYCHST